MEENRKETVRPESLPLCDIVMQGGVTSGVVYSNAVVALSRKFRLKNIGGTSVGALAAAVTAAAELGRLKHPEQNPGYSRLDKLTEELSAKGSSAPGVTRLFDLFQPQPGTRALFHILKGALNRKSKVKMGLAIAVAALRFYSIEFVGASIAVLLIQNFFGHEGPVNWVFATALALVVGFVFLFLGVWKTVAGPFVANGFGLSTGYLSDMNASIPVGSPQEPLTLWLSRMINENAGKDADGPPLTFGELWNPGVPGAGPPAWLPDVKAAAWRYIDLQMISTSVTHCRPYRFPVEDEDQELFFKTAELERWFPPNVISHLASHAGTYVPGASKPQLAAGMFKLPSAKDLPIVFAARLSLSFPVLLSGVPLYSIDYDNQVYKERKFERCWFSDGGICSNFPIHFFDAPLPLWPTFGIALENQRKYQPIREEVSTSATTAAPPADARVDRFFFPSNNEAGRGDTIMLYDDDRHAGATRLGGFFGGIFKSARYWQDHMLMRAPAVRDRVVRVYLKADEGGLNLNMPPPIFQTLSAVGERAATMLADRFCPGSTDLMNFDNHRWVRLRGLTRVLEADISSVAQAATATFMPGLMPTHALIASIGPHPGGGFYSANTAQCAKIQALLTDLQTLAVTAQSGGDLLRYQAPKRTPVLRIVPDV